MNKTIEVIKNHRSIRKYINKDVGINELKSILDAAQSMPTSINGQQLSIVVVKDESTRQKISEIAGNQPWIAAAPVFFSICNGF